MAVYNGEKYLQESIEGILNQTYTNFEFLIINDCSTDNTSEILASYEDPRISIFVNKQNLGLTRSLNIGLRLARGIYIARQDVDDISLPIRLEKQVDFIERNSRFALLGTGIAVINEYKEIMYEKIFPEDPLLLRWHMLFKTTIAHSSVMFHKEKVRQIGGYDSSLKFAQDYDLWSRLILKYDIATLPEILILLRNHKDNISLKYGEKQQQVAIKCMSQNISKIVLREIPLNIIRDLRTIMTMGILDSKKNLHKAIKLYECIYLKVIHEWKPNKNITLKIKKDYLNTMKIIILNHSDSQRLLALQSILTIFFIDLKALFSLKILLCIIKIFLGRYLISQFKGLLRKKQSIMSNPN
ncbi:MAG: glycosyltransferase [Chitinispirillia bacterium]